MQFVATWTRSKQLPTWRFKTENKVVRPTFTVPEHKRIYERLRAWIREATSDERIYTRELVRDYILFLANSGMRVGVTCPLLAVPP